jgi:hypothetical protein
MQSVNTNNQQTLTKKQKKNLILVGAILGFLSGFGFFAFKVIEHAKPSKQLMVKGIYDEYQN